MVVGSGRDSLPHSASHSLPVSLTAVQLFLEISKEQAVMEFLWLGVDFSDFSGESLEGAEREPSCANPLSKQEKCNREKLSGVSDRNPQRDKSHQEGSSVCAGFVSM